MGKTVWSKVILIIGIVLILSIGTGAFMHQKATNIKLQYQDYLVRQAEVTQLTALTADLNLSIVQVQQWLTDISATRAAEGYDDGFAEAKTYFEKTQVLIKDLKSSKQTSNEELEALSKGIAHFYDIGQKMAWHYIKDGHTGGNAYMGTFDGASEDLQKILVPFFTKMDNLQKSLNSEITNELDLLIKTIIITFIGMALFVAFTLIVLSRWLSSVIKEKTHTLSTSVEQLISTSHQLGDKAHSMNDVVSNQASSLQESVSSLEEISSMVQKSADAANNSMKISMESSDAAIRGKKTVEDMTDSIGQIAKSNNVIMEEIQKSNEEISLIVNVIAQIGEKTKVINDIVFQTKLLSFNASVEAARAGEHGKGFAVVAEEVGNLAAMSGKAALEISEMLENSIKEVTNTVESTKGKIATLVEEGKQKVDRGIETAHECDEALDEIMKNVNLVNDKVKEIAASSSEQSIAVNEVNAAIGELDRSTNESTTISNETLSMSKTINGQTESVKDVIVGLTQLIDSSKEIRQFEQQNVSNLTNHDIKDNVLDLEPVMAKPSVTPNAPSTSSISNISSKNEVIGGDLDIPAEDDPRFEEC